MMNASLKHTLRRVPALLILFFALHAAAQKGGKCPPGTETVSTVFRAGEPDGYRLPTEKATPGPILQNYASKWRDFDDMSPRLAFGHTFQDLPCMIISARLVLYLTPGEGGMDDTIGLVADGEGFAWSANLRDIAPGWEPFRPYELTLDLTRLPGPKGEYNLLNDIAAYRALDVYINGDTGVDAMELYITWCQFEDCNDNCVPDEEDIAIGTSKDDNRNGIPDECEEPQQGDPIQILCERYRLVAAGENCCGWVTLAPSVANVQGDYTITNDYDPAQGGYLEDCFPMGVTHVRFTLTDLSTGQTVSCVVTVHVVDNSPPVITPKEN